MTGTQLAQREDQAALSAAERLWTEEQRDAIRKQLVPQGTRVTDADLALFGMVCERAGLDPFLRQAYLIPTREGPKIHIGIDGLRLIAAR
ncbi:MAG: recombinase RecT, partial [Chloroflexota bacterium]